MSDTYLIKMEEISKKFGGVIALEKANLNVKQGEIHALVGENGAGKSTLMKILAGAEKKDTGKIYIKGSEVNFKNPLDAKLAKIAVIYQEPNLVPNLDVSENIFLGNAPGDNKIKIKMNHKLYRKLAKERLDQLGIDINPGILVEKLNTPQRQIVEIARALESDADIIIMDEPTSTLSSKETSKLFEIINKLKEEGKTIIYISHRLEEVMKIADRVTVLRNGSNIATKKISEVHVYDIVKIMLGSNYEEFENMETRKRKNVNKSRKILLKVEGLSRKGHFQDISFELHQGEILGIVGLVGSGKTEIARSLFGIDLDSIGKITVRDQLVEINSPEEAIKLGIGLVPEDRKREGSFLDRSVTENLTISSLDLLNHWGGVIKKQKSLNRSTKIASELNVKISSLNQLLGQLSGGNQQKVVIGKWILRGSLNILILDEPTRGIDVGSKALIYEIIKGLAGKELGVIVMSSEVPEICRLCNKVIVLYKGKVNGCFTGEDIKEENILSCVLKK